MGKRENQNKKLITGFSRLFFLLYGVTIFCFLAFFSSGTIESEDGALYLSVARNIYYQHKIIAPAQSDYPSKNINMNSLKKADGQWHAPGSTGYSFTLVPAVFLSDLFHQYYKVEPPHYFPLQSDWSVLFFASFNNCFWAALLAVLMVVYGHELGWSKKESLGLSLTTILATNLFPMAKFGFAQMLFTFWMMLCFYLMRKYAREKRIFTFGLFFLAFLILMSAYNVSFYLTIPPIVLYYLSLQSPRELWWEVRRILILIAVAFAIKWRLFLALFQSFHFFFKVFFEGFWGLLLSPGKSMFLYSPPLLLLPMFWHKINKKILPEFIAFGTLSGIFIFLLGSAWIPSPIARDPIWHGGMAWGPRYMVPLLPGLMILCFYIFKQLSALQKRFIFYPLIILSICIQLTGSSVSYLLQYEGLPISISVNKEGLNVFDYASFIPRYSPLLKLPRMVQMIASQFPESILHGKYNVRLYDGFDIPLHIDNKAIRGFRHEGHVSFSEYKDTQIQTVQITLMNVPDTATSAEVAHISLLSKSLPITRLSLPINEPLTLSVTKDAFQFQDKKGFLDLFATYDATPSAPHVIYIKELLVNNEPTNLGSIDYPDASSLGNKTSPIPYQYYGRENENPWELWYMRALVSERTFDFWWIKNLYYWDRPQRIIWLFFATDVIVFVAGTIFTVRQYQRETKT